MLAVLVVVGGVAVFYGSWARVAEPVYHGKPLSYWLVETYTDAQTTPYGGSVNEANQALDEIGTNAIPTMLRMLAAKDSRWVVNLRLKLLAVARKTRLFDIVVNPALRENLAAIAGFERLGAGARTNVSVAAWLEIYDRHPSAASQNYVLMALGDLGPAAKEAAPSLLRTATNTNSNPVLRAIAFKALGRIHAAPELVMPAMLQAAHDPNPMVRDAAIDDMGFFGADAKAAVGALVEILRGSDASLRETAFRALEQIDPEAARMAREDGREK